jgi:hypothetical protein
LQLIKGILEQRNAAMNLQAQVGAIHGAMGPCRHGADLSKGNVVYKNVSIPFFSFVLFCFLFFNPF